jgi:hypothetical protein
MNEPKPGAIGVMLGDTRNPARMFRFIGMFSCAIGEFEPLDDAGARIWHNVRDFWPLLDSMPT